MQEFKGCLNLLITLFLMWLFYIFAAFTGVIVGIFLLICVTDPYLMNVQLVSLIIVSGATTCGLKVYIDGIMSKEKAALTNQL